MDQLLAESISAQVTPAESDPVETSKETDEQTAARQPHVHSYTVRKVNATCSANGRNIYRCSCGDVYATIVYKTYNHDLHQVEKTFSSNGRQFTNCANICKDCGIEIIYRGAAGDGTTVSFYISGYFDKDNFYKLLDGELVIYGSGDMLDYCSSAEYPLSGSSSERPPWYLLSKNYPSIRIAEGITSVGENAFADCCEYISSVTIGKTVTHIDANAFASGTNIETLYLPASLQSISAGAFCDSQNIHIKYEGTAEEFALLDLGDLSYASVEFNVEY